jgi:hypothetical protein
MAAGFILRAGAYLKRFDFSWKIKSALTIAFWDTLLIFRGYLKNQVDLARKNAN